MLLPAALVNGSVATSELHIGPFTFQVFGVCAACAVVAGVWYARRVAQRELQNPEVLLDMAPWFLLPGFAGAHLVAVASYAPHAALQDNYWVLANLSSGLSSYGGLFAGALGALVFLRRHGLPVLPWLDVLARGFSLAFVFGRAGCALVHDHPGGPSGFFLAMNYPARAGFAAGPHHDLGFYELLLWLAIFAVFHRLSRRRHPDGFYLGLLIVWYAPVRFGLDFLRINDPTHLGLTFAQWSSLLVLPFGWSLLLRCRHAWSYPSA